MQLLLPDVLRHSLTHKFAIKEQLLRRNVQRFRGELVVKAHRLVYHSALGLTVIKKKKKQGEVHWNLCRSLGTAALGLRGQSAARGGGADAAGGRGGRDG